MMIRFYNTGGLKTREWQINEYNVAYAEQVFDPDGTSRFSHYLKDQIHSAYAPAAGPALAQPAVPASTDKGTGGGALAESGQPVAKLPNGVTVRCLAYSQLTPTGLNWWNAKSDLTSIPGVVEADVEGLGIILAFQIDPPQAEVSASLARGAGVEEFKTQWQLGDSGTWLFAIGDQRSYANVSISTLVRDPPVVGLIPLTGEDQGKAVEANRFGVAQIVDLQVVQPGKGKPEDGAEAKPPVVQFTVVKSPISSPSVVAVEDKEGLAHELSHLSDHPRAATYRVDLWPEQLASVVVEGSLVRQSHVLFRNISLAPDRTTKVQVETDPTPTVSWFRSKVSQTLSVFVEAIKQYLKDQHGQLPVSLEGMKGYLPEDNWLTEHLAYIAKGGPVPPGGSSVIVAYDKTLLPQGKGTYVVYASIYGGSVRFESPKQLAELGILPSGQAAQPTPASEDVMPTGRTSSPSPQAVAATLANGVKVELLAYSQWTQEGLTWWTPAGKSTTLPGVNEADIEGLGTVLAFRTEPAIQTLYAWLSQPPSESKAVEKKWRLKDSSIWLVALGKADTYVNIDLQGVVADPLVVKPVMLKKEGTGARIAVRECGISAITDLTAIDGGPSRFNVHWDQPGPRVVAAVDTAGALHPVRAISPRPVRVATRVLPPASYEVDLPPDQLASIVIEGHSERGGRVSFRNVSLTPTRPTQIRVEVTPQQQGPWWRENPDYSSIERLGRSLSRYAEDHGGQYPANLSVLKDVLSETEWQWLEQNTAYLDRAKVGQAAQPLAYDKTLLPLGFGTYVVYADARIEFEVPDKLRELNIPASGAAGAQAAPGARENMLQLGLAIAMYADEHNGNLPPTLEPLEPYLRDPEIFTWLKDNVIYTGRGNLKDYPAAYSVVTAYEKALAPTGGRYVVFLDGHVELANPDRLKALGLTTAEPSSSAADVLRHLMDEALPGATVVVPKGTYRIPIEITKAVVLRGESQEDSIIEVTADQPAILVKNVGKGNVTIENLTIRWMLATDARIERPVALLVKDTNALIRNCRFVPLGDSKRSPMAVYIDGRSKSTVDNCRFNGFEYTICYGAGTEGVVQDCIITDSGHQGVINYDGATLTVQRCIITGSKFHAVRCTGGTLHVKDNLLIKNANRGIYLGNKSGRGTIANNLILGNGTGISAFGRADYAVANNVIVSNDYAGIDMRDSCLLSIRNNVLARNQRGIMLHKEGTENSNVIAKNAYWANATDVENMDKPEGSITADPQFADPNHGDFSVSGPVQQQGDGLTDHKIIKELWKRYEQLQAEPGRSSAPQTSASDATTSAPHEFSERVVDARGSPVAGAQVALCTKDKGVTIGPTGLLLNKMGGRSTEIVQTDAQGRFSFPQVPEEFQLVAAHESGFAWVADKELASSRDLPLQPWGRIEGTLRIGRETGGDKDVSLLGYINRDAIDQGVRYDYRTKTNAKGWFLFKKVPPGWMEVGYTTQVGDATWSDTCRTPVRVEPGESVKMMLGGTGRPVVGKFVPPKNYDGPVYFGEGLRALATVRPETPSSPPTTIR
jgi:nitrous oxidase accessory protein NosD